MKSIKTKKLGKVTIPKIRLTGDTGTVIEIDITNLDATEEQKAIVTKLLSNDLSALDVYEKDLIKDLKAYVGLENVTPAFIVRFDAQWVRIDEK
ncbi:hypothetical protein [Acinetobacter oleivorans]